MLIYVFEFQLNIDSPRFINKNGYVNLNTNRMMSTDVTLLLPIPITNIYR